MRSFNAFIYSISAARSLTTTNHKNYIQEYLEKVRLHNKYTERKLTMNSGRFFVTNSLWICALQATFPFRATEMHFIEFECNCNVDAYSTMMFTTLFFYLFGGYFFRELNHCEHLFL